MGNTNSQGKQRRSLLRASMGNEHQPPRVSDDDDDDDVEEAQKSPRDKTKPNSDTSSMEETGDIINRGKEVGSECAVALEGEYSRDFSLLESSSDSSKSLSKDKKARGEMDAHQTSHKDQAIRRQQAARADNFDTKTPDNVNNDEEDGDDGKRSFLQFRVKRSDQETKAFLLLVCIVGAALIAVFTYVYTSQWEDAYVHATPISTKPNTGTVITLQHLETKLQQQFETAQEVFQSESEGITAIATASHANWPFWELGDFDRRGSHMRRLVPSLALVGLAPLVDPAQVAAWERYSTYIHQGHDYLVGEQIESELEGTPLAPIWQTSPSNRTLVNSNLLSRVGSVSNPHLLLQDWDAAQRPTKQELIVKATATHSVPNDAPLGGLTDWIPTNSLLLPQSQSSGGATTQQQPYSLWVQPIYDSNNADRSLQAILFGVFSWEVLLEHILKEEEEGAQVLLSNACGDHQFEYNSPSAGSTSSSQPMHIRPDNTNDAPLLVMTLNNQTASQPSLCHYYLELRHLEQPLPSNNNHIEEPTRLSPAGFTSVVATVLLVLGCLIIGYLKTLQDHFDQVQNLATHASGVLLSMFPPNVCERILQEAAEREQTKRERRQLLRESMGSGSQMSSSCSINTSGSSGKKTRGSRDCDMCHHRTNSSIDDNSSHSDDDLDDLEESEMYDNMLMESLQQNNRFKAKPIADLFPEATVCFSDVVGFTAWSSSRCPTHVFDLLETIYHTFDNIARRRKVFKVETIGDCYVAVTGIPTPRADHAVLMARFARDCLHAMDIVTANLEAILGPDTADLSMRFGIHSGPVTAGVLRGERSRFQLFGDTVNVAARMESNSKPGRIHISQDTANYLAADDKSTWFLHREDKIHAKGKGELQTYWVDPQAIDTHSKMLREAQAPGAGLIHPTLKQASGIVEARKNNRDLNTNLIPEKRQRLIDWHVDQLHQLLLLITARRKQLKKCGIKPKRQGVIPQATVAQAEVTVFEEVKEVIEMPAAHPKLGSPDTSSAKLDDNVLWQLNDWVTSISTLYKDNPFHSFEHASHVTLSVTKMLRRVVAGPQGDKLRASLGGSDALLIDDEREDGNDENPFAQKDSDESEDYSYGITSDPITQFAVVLAALIHDVDHVGVSNAQLVKENDRLARIYRNQSVAEQNSVNLAWDLLMDPSFSDLRKCIYSTEEEYSRFRAMLINAVMATDIVDADLKRLRNARWEKAFSKQDNERTKEEMKEDNDRIATVIVEHMIQASDVAHTMQHWHVYQKWNFLLFQEMYIAYKKGRMAKNPLEFWYNGEIGFFDFYIIPLAKKLKECGVFGVSCDEYLTYALNNRSEWCRRGKEIVKEYRTWTEERDRGETPGISPKLGVFE